MFWRAPRAGGIRCGVIDGGLSVLAYTIRRMHEQNALRGAELAEAREPAWGVWLHAEQAWAELPDRMCGKSDRFCQRYQALSLADELNAAGRRREVRREKAKGSKA